MRHRIAFRKLSRPTAHRLALLRNLVTSLIEHEKITTTVPKAKEARRLADKMVTVAKTDNLTARNRARQFVYNPACVNKLFESIAPRFLNRTGGYTRIMNTGFRQSDRAPVATLEYLDRPAVVPPIQNFAPRRWAFFHRTNKPKKAKKDGTEEEESS